MTILATLLFALSVDCRFDVEPVVIGQQPVGPLGGALTIDHGVLTCAAPDVIFVGGFER